MSGITVHAPQRSGDFVPYPVQDLRTPAYIVDMKVASANAARMLASAKALGVAIRPHVKTHKTVELALLQTGGVRKGITVSTLAEAAFFADRGWDDIQCVLVVIDLHTVPYGYRTDCINISSIDRTIEFLLSRI
jgi:hypothetical protein